MSNLRDQAESFDGYAPGWKPTEGDVVAGTVVNMDVVTREDDFGDGPEERSYPVLTVEDEEADEGRVSVHVFHKALHSQLLEHGVGVGSEVAIKYLGLTESGKTGNTYHNYRVFTDREEALADEAESYADFSERALLGGEDELPF